jgi:DNA-directed RNA polymerase subunit RPC12/RpoP
MSIKNISRHWSADDCDLPSFERIIQSQNHPLDPEGAQYDSEYNPRRGRPSLENPSFRCCRCKAWVESDPELAGVKHRNHCPYCLHSRHLDQDKPGDRRSDCHAAMRPIGLTLKATHNKYGSQDGELILIHQCLGCGKLSINRIAADDNAERLLVIFDESAGLDLELRVEMATQAIRLLIPDDLNLVLMRLYGTPNIELSLNIPARKERAKV